MSVIGDWWRDHHEFKGDVPRAPRLTCADGFNISVQAGPAYDSEPRWEYLPAGDYTEWEMGFPTQVDDPIVTFASQPDLPLQSIYSFVPTSVVDDMLARHGGIRSE